MKEVKKMKRFKFLFVFFLMVSVTAAFAAKSGNGVQVMSSTDNKIILKFYVNDYNYKVVKTPKGKAVELVAPNTGKILKEGAPGLLKLAASVLIPDSSEMKLEVIGSKFIDIKNVKIAPSKGNLTRDINPEDVPYVYGREYQTNAFYPGGELANFRKPHIIRDFRGQTVIVYPFQYNPVTRVLRIYTRVGVRISDTGRMGKNILVRPRVLRTIDSEFNKIYSRHFVNFSQVQSRYTPLPDDIGNMLIVSYSAFMSEMSDFVSWKESYGYNVDLVDYATIGSSSALKTYVANYYNTNGLTFLLLVGDGPQIPPSTTPYGDSDNNYGYIVGNDSYLDIFVGRFSAETVAHVTTQVDRSIWYERDLLASETWFRHAIGMGSIYGPGHNGEYDWEHIDLLLADLAAYGYTTHTNHQSGGSTANLANLINAGAGCMWYCGHGSTTCWANGWYFCNADVDALVNDYKLPFIVSVACVVGDFRNNTCFCEAWLRATNNSNGNPTGAVAHAGSTINQSWNPPMDAQDEVVDLLVSETGPKRTFGGIFANGLFKMIDINGSAGVSMADTWTCFGDASIQLRTPGTPNGPIPGNLPPVADFTYTINGLTVTFTDQSYDPDGTVVSWLWDFGDGSTSTLQNPVHTYIGYGTYSVTLTVTDNEGATGTVTKIITLSGPQPDIYVFDITQTITKQGANYKSTAVVTIKDTNGDLVPDATVYITWSGVVGGSDSGVTLSNGTVTFVSASVKKQTGPFTITVTNVTHATKTYNPSLNIETSDTAYY